MNRLAMIAVTCFLGFALTACGEQSTPRPTTDTTETPAVQTTSPTPDQTDSNKTQ
ncbi:hypothetical protein TUM19329_25030 [Legionella antarctica]|uniref:Uncharacterized protein n=1 Tax=Legionella antarctica TaxID=2708020 RepID=A0A6F8T7Y1_9GAMM|nr:hypothetical protein [Legionella antarctica]BCA96142.1 hypothetical protein TUM19329_25030 [Legionella antarctica]